MEGNGAAHVDGCEYAAGSTKGCGDEMLTFAASKATPFTTVRGTTHVCNTHAPAWQKFAEKEGYVVTKA